jgi:hypothetical protein
MFLYPSLDSNFDGLAPLKSADARALGGFVLTLLFGLRVYNAHWAGAATAPQKKRAESGKKGVTAKAQ